MHLIHYAVRAKRRHNVQQTADQAERVTDRLLRLRGDGVEEVVRRILRLPGIVLVLGHFRRLPLFVHFDKHIDEGEKLVLAVLRMNAAGQDYGGLLLAKRNSNAVHRSASFIPVSSQLIVNAHSPAIYLKLYSIVGEYMVFSVG